MYVMKKPLFQFSEQPDICRRPLKALAKRVFWKFHWLIKRKPMILKNWYASLDIILPKSGSAAQVFYRGHSSIEIVRVMEKVLKHGDAVLDIGAHIGEYTLIAAHLVGSTGVVYAIEPQPECVHYIRRNCEVNGLQNVRICQLAIGDRSGSVSFRRDPRSWGGFIVTQGGNLTVQCVRLDDLVTREGLKRCAFIKVDAAGNEIAVLKGGISLLTSLNPPMVICKLYHPQVVRERFGYDPVETLQLLRDWGYNTQVLFGDDSAEISPDNCYKFFQRGTYGLPVLASRESKC
jgi:FkbM family methyltransferase